MSVPPAPGAGDPATPPAPAHPHLPQIVSAPPVPQANVPPIPGVAQPAIPRPPAPQYSMPSPPAPVKAPSTNVLLLAIVGLLMFLAGGLVVFLLMRR